MTETFPPLPADDLARSATIVGGDDPGLTHLGIGAGTYTILVSGEETGGRYSLIDMFVPAGGPPPHRHDFEEMFHILEGELELTFRGETHRAAAGQTVNIPANAPHGFRILARYGWFSSQAKTIVAGIIVTITSTIVSIPIIVYMFGGVTGSGTDFATAYLLAMGNQLIASVAVSNLIQNLADKVITCVVAWLIAIRLPRNFTTGLPFFAYTKA